MVDDVDSAEPKALDQTAPEQARELALEKLVGFTSGKPEQRSRIFSFSSRASAERPLPASTTLNTVSSSEASIQVKTPKPTKAPLGSPDVSPQSSFLFSHDPVKHVHGESKSDCNLM